MKFDSGIAIAELQRAEILMAHHLRRIRIDRDDATARIFYQKLSKLAEDARRTYKEVRNGRDNLL